MKKHIALFAFLLITTYSYSQNKDQNEQMKIGNYIIKSTVNVDSTYGFTIYLENQKKAVLQQKIKPYSIEKTGFVERQNAMVAGIWYVTELQHGRNDIKMLTLTQAKVLGITQKDLN